MGRIIGLIGCTCLVIAVLRLANMGHEPVSLKGGVASTSAARTQSAQANYRRGKEQYLRGHYQDAADALLAALGNKTGLSANERRQAEDYLARTQAKLNGLPTRNSTLRGQSPESDDEFAPPVIPGDAARTRVERLMMQAQSALQKGQAAEARKFAQQAVQFAKDSQLKFDSREITPAQLLARIDAAGKSSRVAGDIRQAGGVREEQTRVQLTAAESEEASPWNESEETAELSDLTPEALAKQLVSSARADLKAGRFDEARRKALQADELDVPWSLFEDQPRLILEEIDHRSDSTTLARTPARKPASSAPGSREAAVSLLKQARTDLEEGRLESAREKAIAAQGMKAVFKTFDDRPELVLQDVDAQQMSSSSVGTLAETENADEPDSESARPSAADKKQQKQQALALLAEARKALAAGRIDDARQLALEAEEMNVALDIFDDRPDTVLADIARSAQKQGGSEFPSDGSGASTNRSEGANLAAKKLAVELMKQARLLYKAGKLEDAYAKAEKADQLQVSFDLLEDRPDALLAEIEQAMEARPVAARTRTTDPDVRGVGSDSGRGRASHAGLEDGDDLDALAPIGLTAVEYYRRGLTALKQGQRDKAYAEFLAAHHTGQKLDRVAAQRLQDFLRELAPRGERVRTVTHQVAEGDAAATDENPVIDTVDKQMQVQHDRLRSDVANAVFKAERLRDKDPEKGLQTIDQALATIEGSTLTGEARGTLIRSLQRSRSGLEATIAQQQPNLEQKRKNEEVIQKVKSGVDTQIRIEQEFARLVEEFNDLYGQRRYAEAEVVAKKAQELAPREPTAVTMFWKARFARRNDSNEKLKLDKEESFWKQMDDVEQAAINPTNDKHPIHYGDDWKDITARRKGKYHADNHIRSDAEIHIEKSLGKRISLHEDQVPLNEVLAKIGALAGFNIYIDDQGLEDEQVGTQTPVTIDVEAITVKSALNLLLERYNLAYTIQNEVLKITSRMRQQGDMLPRTYNVADLVVPIPSHAAGFAPGMTGIPQNNIFGAVPGGAGGAQFSVPPHGVPGQAFPQVGANADVGPMGVSTGNPRVSQPNNHNYDFDTLSDLIVSTIAPESWEAVGGHASIRHYETTLSLVIRQTQRVHEEIADLLGQLRRLQDLQVTIEARFVTVSDRFFERIGLDFDFNVPGTLGRAEVDNTGLPIGKFGTVQLPAQGQAAAQAGQAQQGGQQQGQQAQAGNQTFIQPDPTRNLTPTKFSSPTVVGMSAPGQWQQNYDVPFNQGSFEVGVPTFGGFNPNAGVQVGFAILSDIEAFFFIQAAQADQRNNLMFAPKVTLFNGQTASVSSFVSRPFVVSLIPTVGFFSTGFQPVIQFIPDGIFLTVTAVISADRRYVRLTCFPQFTNITDVFTFSFLGGGAGGGQQQGQGGGQLGQGGFGGQGGQGFGGQGFGIGGQLGQNQQGQQGQNQQGQQGNAVQVTIQQPITEVVNVTTTVSVPDGGTVLLGGVKRLREGRSQAGVPILNKIPYLSRLFKNTGVGRETESAMLMVTPRIIIQEEEEELLGIPTR